MASSVVEICNAALADLGQDTIMSLTDGSRAARLCNQRWPSVRDAVLREHTWNSCTRLAILPASATPPAWMLDYSYPLPVDCLRVVAVSGDDGGELTRWRVMGRNLLCDEPAPLNLAYVSRELDPTVYDPSLCEVLAARLAAVLAYPLTASASLAQAKWAEYEALLRQARGLNAREGGREQQAQATGTWLAAKGGA